MQNKPFTFRGETYYSNPGIKRSREEIQQGNVEYKNKYIDSLLHPFDAPICGVPKTIPYPTHIFQDPQQQTLTIGTTGTFFGLWAPNATLLMNTGNCGQWFFFSPDTVQTVNGSTYPTTYGAFQSASFNQAFNRWTGPIVPPYSSMFQRGRLVSAGIKINYIGRADAHAGYICCGSAITGNIDNVTVMGPSDVMQLDNTVRVRPMEGITCNWFPHESSSTDFQTTNHGTDSGAEGLTYFFAGFGIPVGATIDIQFVTNYEFLPNTVYTELFSKGKEPVNTEPAGSFDKIMGYLSSNSHWFSPSKLMDYGSMAMNLVSGGVKAIEYI